MARTINVTIDRYTLQTSLRFDDLEDALSTPTSLMISTIPDVSIADFGFTLPWRSFKKNLTNIARVLKREGGDIRFDQLSQLLVDQWLDDRQKFNTEKWVLKFSRSEIQKMLSKSGFSRKLTSEQFRDVKRLLALKHGANFSVPGAGKTTSLLAVHSILKAKKLVDCLFVVCPINAFISWEDEIVSIYEKNDPKVIRLTTIDLKKFRAVERQNPDVILVNYEKMRNNLQGLFPFFLRRKLHLVLDESHRIKGGENNLSYQQLISLADLAKRRDILSGTPLPQSVMDLDPQFDFLWSRNIVEPLLSDRADDGQLRTVNTYIKNLFVRTTKAELGIRPPRIKYTYIEMGPVQSELYELFRSEAARVLSGVDRSTREYLRNVGRSVVGLLQAASNPILIGTEDDFSQETLPLPSDAKAWNLLSEYSHYERAAKIDYLTKRVDKILQGNPKNKVVIWSCFVRNVKLLERVLSIYSPVTIYGAIPSGTEKDQDNREQRIRRFHEDSSCRLMIANPQAGGEGISLHRICHYAMYLDRTFNAAHYLQSVDRIHRLGLPKDVNTYVEILVAKGTIDEVVAKRLNNKTKIMAKVLNDPELVALAYDPEDLEDNGVGLNTADLSAIEEHILKPNA